MKGMYPRWKGYINNSINVSERGKMYSRKRYDVSTRTNWSIRDETFEKNLSDIFFFWKYNKTKRVFR